MTIENFAGGGAGADDGGVASAAAAKAPSHHQSHHRRTSSAANSAMAASATAAAAGGGSGSGGGGGGDGGDGGGGDDGEGGGEGNRLELLVHDNLTLGLLRQRLKRELVAAGLPKVPYQHLQLLKLKGGASHPANASSAAMTAMARQASGGASGGAGAAAAAVAPSPILALTAGGPLAGIQQAAATPLALSSGAHHAATDRKAVGDGGGGDDWVALEGEVRPLARAELSPVSHACPSSHARTAHPPQTPSTLQVRTLRELGVGDGHAIVARIAPATSASPTADKKGAHGDASNGATKGESHAAKLEGKHVALPPVMISRSNAYMACLFEVIRSFSRCPTVVAQAWDLLMRVPTNSQSLAHLAHPQTVAWEAEMAQAATQPMRLLYSLQVRWPTSVTDCHGMPQTTPSATDCHWSPLIATDRH